MSHSLRRELWLALAFLALLALPPLFTAGYSIRLLNLAVIAGIAVLGLNFVFGFAGLISLAQAAFVGVGAYATAILTTRVGLSPWLAMPLAVIVTCLFALVMGIAMLRLRGHYLALGTLGLNVSFVIVASNWVSLTGGMNGITAIPALNLFGLDLHDEISFFYVGWVALALLTLAAYRIRASHLGRAMIAVRDDEIATEMSSVDTVRLKILTFVLGAAYAGVAGVLLAHHAKFISPSDFGYINSIFYLSMLIVGGEGSILGAVLGAVIITFLPEWLRFLGGAYLTFFGVMMLVILIFLPKGMMSILNYPMALLDRRRRGAAPARTEARTGGIDAERTEGS